MIDVTEILTHWYAGRSKSDVAASLGVDRKTVRKYVGAAEAAGVMPGGPLVSVEAWAARVREWFPELVAGELRSEVFAELAALHANIKDSMAHNTLATIHQRLRDEHGLRASLSSLRRYVAVALPEEAMRAKVTVRKDDPPPGSEAQIDYGYLGMWLDPATGRTRRVWAFVMVLACSRHLFVRPVLQMTLAAWIDAHVAAFRFFGGVPARWVPDNLKAGVIKPDLYDPLINRTYAELAVHYGAIVDPARAFHPKDKPRVERPMRYVRDSFWAGRTFSTLKEMVDAAEVWSAEVAGRRVCRPLEGATPADVFAAIERDALGALPANDFEMRAWSTPKVAPDTHIQVAGALYSVPWRLIGRTIDVRATAREIACYVDGELVKTHARIGRGRLTDWNDYPPEKVAFLQRTPAWCRHRATELGDAVGHVIGELLAGQALHHLRAAQGIIGLADRYGAARLNAACERAHAAGDGSYRTIKGILAAGLEQQEPEQPPLPSNAPAFLHGADAILNNRGQENVR